MSRKTWYGTRCLFEHHKVAAQKKNVYEERVTVWQASNADEAIQMAEKEARVYAKEAECNYLNFAQSFELFSEKISAGDEVFSLMRESNLSSSQYLDHFFDTGTEREVKSGVKASEEKYKNYLLDLGTLVEQHAKESIADLKKSKNKADRDFKQGYVAGLHCLVTLMQEQALAFGIKLDDIHLNKIHEKDFIN